jgi:L-Ala-D/L-Glu epimerase
MHFNFLKLRAAVEQWPLITPFRITGHTWHAVDAVVVSLEKDGQVGRGEGEGVYYRQDTPELAFKKIESLRATIETGISRESLQHLLPPGGARNALSDTMIHPVTSKKSPHSRRPLWGLIIDVTGIGLS